MGFLSKIIGGSIGEAADGVANAIDRFVETPEEKSAAEILKTKIGQDPQKWQIELNKIEAAHRSIFVAGWRPAIGWICACCLAWGWIIGPVVHFIFPERPVLTIQVAEAIPLVLALLGVAGMRSYEKKKGVSG